jgi:hypothetical protein
MSQSIWTRCGDASSHRAYEGDAWRVVENQQLVGTRKLVDSEDEHELLELLIDGAKPPPPRGADFEGLHYLLATSFRYPPLRYGSRFGTRAEAGIWYGAEGIGTALAEVAYYRMVFLDGTAASIAPLMVELTAFRASLRTDRALDLMAAPFAAFADEISSPVNYETAQRLGNDMREDAVVLFRYRSARDAEGGANIGLFSPSAFRRKEPFGFKLWHCVVDEKSAEFSRKDFVEKGRFTFPREQFLVDGKLPAPAV